MDRRGIIRYKQRELHPEGQEGDMVYEMNLIGFGDDATTSKLGVF